jgi:hypothetical protein
MPNFRLHVSLRTTSDRGGQMNLTSTATIRARSAVLSLFILDIMLARVSYVKPYRPVRARTHDYQS